MADVRDIVKLGIDGYRGTVEKYSVKESQDTLRQALIEANNGSTKLDYKAIRDGRCNGLFSIIEQILSVTVIEGLQEDDFFNEFVEYVNVAEGDQNLFVIEDNNLFVVDDVADGTQGVRRQRLGGATEIAIPTSMKMIRIYEELNRVLSGRVDFNHMINLVANSFRNRILTDIYTLWTGVVANDLGGAAYFPAVALTGVYDEEALLDTIAHVEAAAGGKPATIVGTKKALRKLRESIQSDGAKDELHNYGFYGKFYGTPCVALPQRHKIGSTSFVFDDVTLTIVAGDPKMIKFVYEGEPIVLTGDPMTNADFTHEYLYGVKYGIGLVSAGNEGLGRYEMAQ